MSIARLPRQGGIWIKCDGTTSDPHHAAEFKHCPEKRFTANIVTKVNRQAAADEGWGRGLRKDRKRADHCPSCLANEQQLAVNREIEREASRRRRDAERLAAKAEKAAASAAAKPKKKRSRADSSADTTSPSEATAPAPA